MRDCVMCDVTVDRDSDWSLQKYLKTKDDTVLR